MARIAIVEDNDQLAELYQLVLERAQFDVTRFFSAEAFLAADWWRFEVVVSDLQLPKMHGVDLIRQIRHHCRCIAISGSDRTLQGQAVLAGAVFSLQKPVSNKALVLAVQLALTL